MTRVRRWFSESFVPLVVVFLAASAGLIWAQVATRERAGRATVIRVLAPSDDSVAAVDGTAEDARVTQPVWVAATAAPARPALDDPSALADAGTMLLKAADTTPGNAALWADLIAVRLWQLSSERAQEDIASAARLLRCKPDPAAMAAALDRTSPPEHTAAFSFNQGLVLSRADEPLRAREAFAQAGKRSQRWEIRIADGLAALATGDEAGARTAFATGLAGLHGTDAARAHFAIARGRDRVGDATGAEVEYRLALQSDASFRSARLNLAVLLAQTGREADAVKQYKELLAEYPDYALAHFNYGVLLARTGELQDAADRLSQALVYRPEHPETRRRFGLVLLDLGRPADAARQFQWLRARSPGEAEYAFLLGRCAWRRRALDEAEALYREAIRKRGGNYPEAWVNLGLVLQAGDDDKGAEDAYRSALRLDPKMVGAHHRLARLLEHKHLEEAIEHHRAAVELRPHDGNLWEDLAQALHAAGRDTEALAAYGEALRYDEDDVAAHINRGVLYAHQDNDTAATQDYRRALELEPDNARAWLNLGLALRRLDQPQEAARALRHAIDHSSQDDLEGTRVTALSALGRVYRGQEQWALAAKQYQAMIALRPDHASARYFLAYCYYRQNHNDEAWTEVNKLLSLEPNSARGWRLAERVAQERHDQVAAARARERADALEKNPTEDG